MIIPLPKFTLAQADAAADDWGLNCGPAAVACMCGLTLDGIRPHLGDFEKKRYTNPTLMWEILTNLGKKWTCNRNLHGKVAPWPVFGLARIQWEGPWTQPGVPPKAPCRYTHWVGVHGQDRQNIDIWDVNCMNNGAGWVALYDWETIIVPFLTKRYPRASGKYHITHSVELETR